jgi:hypothetical protein
MPSGDVANLFVPDDAHARNRDNEAAQVTPFHAFAFIDAGDHIVPLSEYIARFVPDEATATTLEPLLVTAVHAFASAAVRAVQRNNPNE